MRRLPLSSRTCPLLLSSRSYAAVGAFKVSASAYYTATSISRSPSTATSATPTRLSHPSRPTAAAPPCVAARISQPPSSAFQSVGRTRADMDTADMDNWSTRSASRRGPPPRYAASYIWPPQHLHSYCTSLASAARTAKSWMGVRSGSAHFCSADGLLLPERTPTIRAQARTSSGSSSTSRSLCTYICRTRTASYGFASGVDLPFLASFRGDARAAASLLPGRPVRALALSGTEPSEAALIACGLARYPIPFAGPCGPRGDANAAHDDLEAPHRT